VGNPAVAMVSGTGKPRLVALSDTDFYDSTGNTTYTTTSVTESGSPSLARVRANMRIRSTVTGTVAKPTWAKVKSVDDTNDIITVDAWTNGTPTNNQTFYVDGWVIDLPYCYSMIESFIPDHIIHELYGGDAGPTYRTKFRGWQYQCILDYSKYAAGDLLLLLRPALNVDTSRTMTLMPHADQPGFNYEVYFSDQVDISRFGRTPGYKGFKLSFRGKRNVPSWPMIAGYGMTYAQAYGTCL
jgi:hypothetical protein